LTFNLHPRREETYAKFASLDGAQAVLEAAGFEDTFVQGRACLFLPDESLSVAAAIVEDIDAVLAEKKAHGALGLNCVHRVVAAAQEVDGELGWELLRRLRKVIVNASTGEMKHRKLR